MIFKDTFTIISLLSPYLIPLYLLMASFFNQDLKGLFYLIILTVNVYLTFMISKFINLESGLNSDSNLCNFGPFNGMLVSLGSTNNNSLSINSSIIGFTLSYLGYPMYKNNNVNLSILVMFMSLFTINAFVQSSNQCSTTVSVLLGGLIGMLIGYLVVLFFSTSNLKSLMYFDETIDGSKMCKVSKQKFSCKRENIAGPTIDSVID